MGIEKARKKNGSDIYYTPKWVIEKVITLLPKPDKDFVIWECMCGEGHISKYLIEKGYNVISTDIKNGEEFNFLTYEPNQEYSIILTNPAFSIKNKVLKRCYELKKPFLLLLPIMALESKVRIEMFKKYGISYFQLDKRVNYIKYNKNKTSSSPFYSMWFGWNIPNYENNKIYFI